MLSAISFRKNIFLFWILAFLYPFVTSATQPLVAFPGAEGFGAVAKGGRGGKVIKVSNLNESGPGSLQAAASASGPRIIIFEVAGVIHGDIEINHSNITIAGQTAPSPGITVEGRLLARPEDGESLHDIIVRFLRFRPQLIRGETGDTIQLPKTSNVILDHLSLAWGNDEIVDIIHSSDISIQWCSFEESDTRGHEKHILHNFAILSAYSGSGNVTIHHNLFAHHSRRIPSLSPHEKDKPADFINNVVYNFQVGLGHDGHEPSSGINLISNYYKRGPNVKRILPFEFSETGKYFLSGNYVEGLGVVDRPQDIGFWDSLKVRYIEKGTLLQNKIVTAPVAIDTAKTAYTKVLNLAGSFPRDRVTIRTIKEIKEGGGEWGRSAPDQPDDDWFLQGLIKEKTLIDSDDDGIPDRWEEKLMLDKLDGSDYMSVLPTGYSAIEEYLHERAEQLIFRYSQKNVQ